MPPSTYSEELLQRQIACECQEGVVLHVPFYLLLQSKTFDDMWKLQDFPPEEIPDDFVFPIPLVSDEVFTKVLSWMYYRNGKDDPIVEMDMQTNERIPFTYTDFEKSFFDIGAKALTDVLNASNFLSINSLYLYGTHELAARVRGKSVEQIREMIGAVDDLSDKQKEEIRAKNVWCLY